jgi:CDP-6-deoxy-D-xylo-4-hexulose-3-dehydrase
MRNFGVCMDSMRKVNPNFYFITHLLGFPAVTDEFISHCEKNNILFIEDCCEAHGATYNGKKVGNFGICSTFSFFYGHHMTTIEGGMICTDSEEVYHLLLLLRSHGLLRELPEPHRTDRQIANLDKQFTFLTNGFNFRNMEANALLGIRQLENLDKHNDQRNRNYKVFAENIDKNKYLCDFNATGISSFCLPVFAKTVDIVDVRAKLVEIGIEHRPCVGGNLARHPMVKGRSVFNLENCIKSDMVADQCVYVGNHQAVDENMVYDLCKKLNEV